MFINLPQCIEITKEKRKKVLYLVIVRKHLAAAVILYQGFYPVETDETVK